MNEKQQSLFSETASRDLAIDQVEYTNTNRIDDAYIDALSRVDRADREEKLTSDTILPDIDQYKFTDGRAVGAIMRKLISAKVIVPIVPTEYRPSTRPGNHARPGRVYIKAQ